MKDYSVWAPNAERVELVLYPGGERLQMHEGERGNFSLCHPKITPGQRYAFSLDGGSPFPDPRSALQPDGVHGPSCWVDFDSFVWDDDGFRPVPLASAVIYELHVGTFTPAGTFDGVREHLPKLRELGVTHVELMPVAHFPGRRGWGYDGVALFAPHTEYGGPEGLNRLVNACHQHGLAVLLDVVYNHLGPSGNYLGQYGPYFTNRYQTPWGDAINFDDAGSDSVRRFVCDNAKHWLRHYHIDGLRLDAVHAIYDQSATHILAQLAAEVDELSVQLGRQLTLIAESGLNDARVVRRPEVGGYGIDGQWSDDFHHALHTVLSGERSGYYVDFGGLQQLADALHHGFVYRGQFSEFRNQSFGGDTHGVRGRQLVAFLQNHDQVGNRAVGDRLATSLTLGQLYIGAALTALAPFVPLLFMGEEWGARTPFQYFVDHQEPELQEAVRQGRQREFVAFGWAADAVPDPGAPESFERSKLAWEERSEPSGQGLLKWYAALLALRRTHPSLANDRLGDATVRFSEAEQWLTLQRGAVIVACNFSSESQTLSLLAKRLILASDSKVVLSVGTCALPGHAVAVVEADS